MVPIHALQWYRFADTVIIASISSVNSYEYALCNIILQFTTYYYLKLNCNGINNNVDFRNNNNVGLVKS